MRVVRLAPMVWAGNAAAESITGRLRGQRKRFARAALRDSTLNLRRIAGLLIYSLVRFEERVSISRSATLNRLPRDASAQAKRSTP